VSYPGNHASAEILSMSHERGRLWRLPDNLSYERAALACVARYGFGAAIRAGLTLGRSVAVLGLGVIGQFALRCFRAAGAFPLLGIDEVAMRRRAAHAGGADVVIDPGAGDLKEQVNDALQSRGADVVADATGVPDGVVSAMRLAADAGQVVVVGSPRGLASNVNFYDDLHRRYIEVLGAHGNMLFEPAHTRLAGAWTLDKAQNWLLAALTHDRLNLEGLVTHRIDAIQLGAAYEGLLKTKEEYLGVVVNWD
jgi:threonine dehydrogenase-like Zn-dependent dehydrogenase